MKELVALKNQLVNYGGQESALFCGKVMSIALHSGLWSGEIVELVSILITCSVLNRVKGDNFRKIREMCPRLIDFIPTPYWKTKDVPFALFFNQILKSPGA